MDVCVDFDGTCVEHRFPEIGNDVPLAEYVLKQLVEHGHNIILFTMRSDICNPKSSDPSIVLEGGNYLTDACNWFESRGIQLYGVNQNPDQELWTRSPKAYGQLYIDDSALGCPLIDGGCERPYVDWYKVLDLLIEKRVLPSYTRV